MEDNKKTILPFIKKDLKDFTNDGDTISQNYKKFNNSQYVKKFNTFSETWNSSTTITDNSQTYTLGDTVQVSDDSEKNSGKKGKIVLGFALENSSNMLNIKFKDGKEAMIDKMYIKKICEQDYNLVDDIKK